MSKAPLKDVQENMANMRPCPNCSRTPGLSDCPANQMGPGSNGKHPRGRFKGYFRSTMPVCDFCKGLRVVFPNRICECGWPAVKWDEVENVWCCGSGICAKSASYRKLHPHTHTAMGPSMDWYGHGNGFGMGG